MSTARSLKRSRPASLEEGDGQIDHHPAHSSKKRQCSLPLRLSPSASSAASSAASSSCSLTGQADGFAAMLTPAASVDEEMVQDDPSTASPSISRPNPVLTTDMPPPPSAERWRKPSTGRQRANGISAGAAPPPVSLKFPAHAAAQQTDANGARIPTPIYGHFASTDVNMDTSEAAMNSFIHPAARFQLRRNPPILSPMMSDDGDAEPDRWRPRRLPSPAESPLLDHPMQLDAADPVDDLTTPALGAMDLRPVDHRHSLPTPAATPRPSSASPDLRKGKLVMGFRPDCGQCQNRDPAHYSHIVWS